MSLNSFGIELSAMKENAQGLLHRDRSPNLHEGCPQVEELFGNESLAPTVVTAGESKPFNTNQYMKSCIRCCRRTAKGYNHCNCVRRVEQEFSQQHVDASTTGCTIGAIMTTCCSQCPSVITCISQCTGGCIKESFVSMSLNLSTAICAGTAFLCSTASQNRMHKLTVRKTELGRLVAERGRLETKIGRCETEIGHFSLLKLELSIANMKDELVEVILQGKETAPRAEKASRSGMEAGELESLEEERLCSVEQKQWLRFVELQFLFEINTKKLEIAELDGSEQSDIDKINEEVAKSKEKIKNYNGGWLRRKKQHLAHSQQVLGRQLKRHRWSLSRDNPELSRLQEAQDDEELSRLQEAVEDLTQHIAWLKQKIDERGIDCFM